MTFSSCPVPPFRHLQRLTDTVGLVARTDGIVPRHGDGYRVDDIARGLMVVCREPSPSAELITLGRRYLYFLTQAQAADGKFRSRLGDDRRWRGPAGARDAWGRSLWALGTAAARGPTTGIREEALARFDASAAVDCPYPHSMAFAALGAAEILERWPSHPGALALLTVAGTVIGGPAADAAWLWPAPRLSYANAAIAEAVIVAGEKLGRDDLLRDGLRMLGWLLAGETRNGHLSVVPAGGWGRGENRPAFDQYPIEVAALADACARAAAVTGDTSWLTGVEMSVAWLLGENDARIPMLDERTGGCSDALSRNSRSRNQGAESTLAMISVLQQGRHLDAALAG
ncbi:MAG: glycosyltransferase [Streptosporangiaceae bacterium]